MSVPVPSQHCDVNRAGEADEQRVLIFDDIRVDLDNVRVRRDGVAIHLGPTEYQLLCFLLRNPYTAHSRAQLIRAIRSADTPIRSCTIDMHVFRLRKALNGVNRGEVIHTVRAVGYALRSAI
ncbi:MAG TPA: winged helix-turn-helix domain-containing protein [Rhizomicrobium sp.]